MGAPRSHDGVGTCPNASEDTEPPAAVFLEAQLAFPGQWVSQGSGRNKALHRVAPAQAQDFRPLGRRSHPPAQLGHLLRTLFSPWPVFVFVFVFAAAVLGYTHCGFLKRAPPPRKSLRAGCLLSQAIIPSYTF